MKNAASILPVLILLVFLLNAGCTASRERDLETDFRSFRTWVNGKASQLAEQTEADWKSARADYKARTGRLDRRQDEFSDELKEEYQQLKTLFRELDADFSEQVVLVRWRRELLGQYADLARLSTANVLAAYTRFLENVRARHEKWTEQDWDRADNVFEQLNRRKAALPGALSTEDEVKIKALQMEYSTLEETSR